MEERTNREKVLERIRLMRLQITGFRKMRESTVPKGRVRPRRKRGTRKR